MSDSGNYQLRSGSRSVFFKHPTYIESKSGLAARHRDHAWVSRASSQSPESPKHRRALAYSALVRALYSRMIYLLPPGATGVTSQHPPGDHT
ncbi:hypothetical protein TcasGA2_TC006377 [Tribolium castaneum]|uniref:Uncharacterized protein n=1 Tax=Tribolium castaneum TaxID=7070 RepID=D6WWF1_TRICA|nr:hypothetical protein TcasGA2_TC006377 [Tribolium castaneum]